MATVIDRLEALAEKKVWTLDDTLFVTRNALPDLLKLARAAKAVMDPYQVLMWEALGPKANRLIAALEPLFREEES